MYSRFCLVFPFCSLNQGLVWVVYLPWVFEIYVGTTVSSNWDPGRRLSLI